MPRIPGPASLAGAATLITCLVVTLGVVLTPGPARPAEARLARAPVAVPTESAPPPPSQQVAQPVVLSDKPEPKPKPESDPKPERKKPVLPAPAELVISSFNVLGSSHTDGGGKRGGMASGVVRIRRVAALLGQHGVDVAGFQEFQGDQYREFLRVAGGTYDVYPGMSAGRLGVENSLVWRTSEWTLIEAHTVQIPYFDGRLRPMPYVLLRHNATGRYAWFGNFHNPASNPKRGNNDGHRARAAAIEAALAVRLRAESGYPVFLTGDFNEREQIFCRMTSNGMIAPNGGSNDGSCKPPGYPMPVDWIFGSDMVDFTSYQIDDGRLVSRTSDHPMIVATAVLDQKDGVPAS